MSTIQIHALDAYAALGAQVTAAETAEANAETAEANAAASAAAASTDADDAAASAAAALTSENNAATSAADAAAAVITANKTVTFVSDLATEDVPSPNTRTIHTRYASVTGDTGGGFWVWNPTSTLTSDGIKVQEITGEATGRWLRHTDGGIARPGWFGITPFTATVQGSLVETWFDYCIANGLAAVNDLLIRLDPTTTIDVDSGALGFRYVADNPAAHGFLVDTDAAGIPGPAHPLFDLRGQLQTWQSFSIKADDTTQTGNRTLVAFKCGDEASQDPFSRSLFIQPAFGGIYAAFAPEYTWAVMVSGVSALRLEYGCICEGAGNTVMNDWGFVVPVIESCRQAAIRINATGAFSASGVSIFGGTLEANGIEVDVSNNLVTDNGGNQIQLGGKVESFGMFNTYLEQQRPTGTSTEWNYQHADVQIGLGALGTENIVNTMIRPGSLSAQIRYKNTYGLKLDENVRGTNLLMFVDEGHNFQTQIGDFTAEQWSELASKQDASYNYNLTDSGQGARQVSGYRDQAKFPALLVDFRGLAAAPVANQPVLQYETGTSTADYWAFLGLTFCTTSLQTADLPGGAVGHRSGGQSLRVTSSVTGSWTFSIWSQRQAFLDWLQYSRRVSVRVHGFIANDNFNGISVRIGFTSDAYPGGHTLVTNCAPASVYTYVNQNKWHEWKGICDIGELIDGETNLVLTSFRVLIDPYTSGDSTGEYFILDELAVFAGTGPDELSASYEPPAVQESGLLGADEVHAGWLYSRSPDGTLYKMQPPNGGGTGTWVAA